MTPSYIPSYEPNLNLPTMTPGQIAQQNAPNLASPMVKAPTNFQGYMAQAAHGFGSPQGQQVMQGGGAPPPPQLPQSAGVHPGTPGGMDPAALSNMLQIYKTLQPSGQLGMQMQAAGVGTQPPPVPGLLSRFQ